VNVNRRRRPTCRIAPRGLTKASCRDGDGLSNKATARRPAVSFNTAKFHVAAILEKLGTDWRTEVVIKAAHRGMVIL
jgi:hypothetical protein